MEKERIMLQLQNIIPQENILEDEPMKKHTSFKIGGNAEFFVKVETLEQLQKILEDHEIMFDGIPLDDEEKQEILDVIQYKLYKRVKELNKRKK